MEYQILLLKITTCLLTIVSLISAKVLPGKKDLAALEAKEYTDRIFFLQQLSGNTNAGCATNTNCCRYRCPIFAAVGDLPYCSTQVVAGTIQRCVAIGGGAAMPVATVCLSPPSNCPGCLTANNLECSGTPECTAIPGNSICPWS